MDTAYGSRVIRRTGNWSNALSYEVQALIRRISFAGYGVLVRKSAIFKFDPTLFTRKAGNDLLLVQIYVDDIIFASTYTAMCDEFANLMTTKFKMSMMGKIDSVDTPIVEKNKLDAVLQGTPVDATLYRDMVGSLMYLTSSRPDLIYAICLCVRYQAKPTKTHLNAVKQIFDT
ncbi:retrovirus-related pol polyprotein from transposon TNT 1-94 [Tanacetum coccineum]